MGSTAPIARHPDPLAITLIQRILFALLVAGGSGPAVAAEGVKAGLTPEKPLSEFSISQWTSDSGLPTNVLTNVLQTRDGYLWIASFNGLVRFDGAQFAVFDKRTTPGLETGAFQELVEGAGGDLWIGTQGAGLWVYRDGELHKLPGDGNRPFTVRSILLDGDSAWVGTGDHGLHKYHAGRWTEIEDPGLASTTIRDVIRDRSGTVWIATDGKGLVELGADRSTHYTRNSGLTSDAVTSLCEAPDGTLWVGTLGGLHRFAEGRIEPVALKNVRIYRMLVDDHGSLWIATERGLIRRNALSGEFEHLESFRGKPLRSISAVAFDREGAVWVASYLDGLYRLKEGNFKNYSVESGLMSVRVNAVQEVETGKYLVGGDDGRISQIDGGGVSEWKLRQPLPEVRVRGFTRDRRGRLWISSYAGLLRISDGEEKLFTSADGLPTNQVRLVFEDRRGRIWIGTQNAGLLRWQESAIVQVLDTSSGLLSNFILSVRESPAGALLIGTYDGLNVLNTDGSITSYGVADGLPGPLVFSARATDNGAVWLSTSGGLAHLQRGAIKSITFAEGLPAESVFDYVEDTRGSVWLSSSEGVIRIAKEQLDELVAGEIERIDAVVYDERDGMLQGECTGATKILKASDGRLWFPTLGGASIISPLDIRVNRTPPPVEISGFTVDSQAIRVPDAVESVIEIGPGRKEYVFDFAALSLLAPSKVKVKYKLIGFDDDWIEAESERRVRYTNLAHGAYTFRAIAANNDGIWNQEGASLRLLVRRPWWRTTWAYVLYWLMLITGVIAADRIQRTLLLRKEQERARIREARLRTEAAELEARALQAENERKEQELAKSKELKGAYAALEEKNEQILHTQQELIERTTYLSSLIENNPLAIVVLDSNFSVTMVNSAFESLFLFDRSEIIGCNLDTLITTEDSKSDATALTHRVLRGQPVLQAVGRRRRQDDTEIDVEIHGVPLIVNGELTGIFGIYQDITERRRMTQQLAHSEKMAALGQLVAGVAHEINNPVNFISSGLPSLRRVIDELTAQVPEEKHDERFEKIRRRITKLLAAIGDGARRTAETVQDLRSFARLDEVELKGADLNEALDSTLTLLRNQTKDRIELVKSYGEFPPVECYIGQLNQVFMNLLINAVQAIDDQGTITITTTRKDENHVRVSIRDDGCGMTDGLRERIFDPFFTTKPVGQGTGLGLSISHGIIDNHGGTIEATSEPGIGAEFTINLPLRQETA